MPASLIVACRYPDTAEGLHRRIAGAEIAVGRTEMAGEGARLTIASKNA